MCDARISLPLCLDPDSNEQQEHGDTSKRPHWITSSARASTEGGIVRPRAVVPPGYTREALPGGALTAFGGPCCE
jgi:hypothetical protein